MKYLKTFLYSIFLATIIFLITGCATYRTIDVVTLGNPMVYSGTRLNIYVIADDQYELKKFDVEPPEHPIIDLPASFVLDTIILPITLSSALLDI